MKSSRSAYSERTRTVAALLEQQRLDALIVTNLTNVRYLSGFRGSSGFLLVTPRGGTLFTDFRYKESSRGEVSGHRVEIYRHSFLRSFSRAAERMKIRRLGFESSTIPYLFYEEFRKALKKTRLVPVKAIVEEARRIKDPAEIERIEAAVTIAERVMKKALTLLSPGVTGKDIALEIDHRFRLEGADGTAFDTIVAFGPDSSKPHAAVSDRPLKKGDSVLIDMGCTVGGYSSDLTRTFFFNTISGRQKKLYALVLEAQRRAIELIRPGIPASRVDRAARRQIAAAGFGPLFGHSLGHGIGLEVHELPRLSSRAADTLAERMVFTVEPGVYIPGQGGVRIEDMVAVTADGCRVLTQFPKELRDVIL
ncbi:MAG TPA: Xaa-Pro peptidase family protein [bacterium]|nr:Xaa-Pro peptidase family protein [bacterium]